MRMDHMIAKRAFSGGLRTFIIHSLFLRVFVRMMVMTMAMLNCCSGLDIRLMIIMRVRDEIMQLEQRIST